LNNWFDRQPFGISEKLKEIENYKEKTERLELLQTTIQNKNDRVALDLIIDAREKAKSGLITKAEKGLIDANALSQNPAVINRYGLFLIEIGLIERSKIQFNKLLEIEPSKNDDLITAIAYGNLGISHQLSENFEEALTCFNKAIEFNKKIGRIEGVASQLGKIGINFRMQKKFDEAKPNFINAHKLLLKIGNTRKIAISFSNLGWLYYDLKEIEKAQNVVKSLYSIMMDKSLTKGLVIFVLILGYTSHN
jgi:tetratricopeptide (TPR) repeat protein